MSGFDPRRSYETTTQDYESGSLYDGWRYKGPNTSDWIVELGVDLAANGIGEWFTLDDTTKGELDNATYLLAGEVLIDITRYARSIQTQRGRSAELEKFVTGTAAVVLDNRDRLFDPLITGAPLSGNIVPRKQVRILYKGDPVFTGNVDDWDYDYTRDKDATAVMKAIDGFQYIASRNVPAQTMTLELTGDRVNHVLDGIGWPTDQRSIDAGSASVAADVVGTGVNALAYLQKVELSEYGLLFIRKDGILRFEEDSVGSLSGAIVGDGGIPFEDIKVQYGTEELTNRYDITYYSGSVTATVTVDDATSQTAYGVFERGIDTLLSGSTAAVALGTDLVARYGTPTYRVDEVSVNVLGIDTASRSKVMSLELSDRLALRFRPLGVGETIDRTVSVDGISHSVTPSSHRMQLQLSDLGYSGATEFISGGTISEYKDGSKTYRLHAWTEPGTYDVDVNLPVTLDMLIVGAGGDSDDGGGGAGGVLAGSVAFTSASTYQVVVGAFTNGASGQSSQFGNVYVADGGGLGGDAGSAGFPGGSGGGGGAASPVFGAGGSATQANIGALIGYGNAGASGASAGAFELTGGGGGAGGAASNNLGGAGLSSSITGASVVYASGGEGFVVGNLYTSVGVNGNPGDGFPPSAGDFWDNTEAGNGVVYVRYEV
jgi:hypothetical protein